MHVTKRGVSKLLLVTVGACLLYFAVGGESNLYRLWVLTRQKTKLEEQIRQAEEKREQLQERIASLKTDNTLIEKIAREKYNMGYRGEKSYRFKSEASK